MLAVRSAVALLILASGAGAAHAGEATRDVRPLDHFSLWLGGFQAHSDTTVTARARFEGEGGSGSVNLERDLGLDQAAPVRHLRLDLLMGHSHGLSLEVFGYRRLNDTRLSRSIEFNGDVFEADARIRGQFDYDFASLSHRRWFGQGATVWGVGLGAAFYRAQTRLDGEFTVNDATRFSHTRTADSAVAPLLALGWRHALSHNTRIYADLSGVAKDGRLSGHIVDAAVGLEWFPSRRAGLALEYGAMAIRLDRQRDDVAGRLDLTLRGPSVFLRFR